MTLPDFSFEKKVYKNGYRVIAGMDEVGRGCFAGPVVAGCVVFPLEPETDNYQSRPVINDSKKLSSKQREVANSWIRNNAIAYGIGRAGASEINKVGIKKATEIAFRRAIVACEVKIDYLLVDAFYIPYVKGLRRKNQKAIIKGDAKSISIAAASIIAKVYRDSLMVRLGKNPKYRMYGWGQNKGYGTQIHREAITKYGITRQHRNKFVETYLSRLISP
jgi:ribonuclease HII